MPTRTHPPTACSQRARAHTGSGALPIPRTCFAAFSLVFATLLLLSSALNAQAPAQSFPGNAPAHPAQHATRHRVRHTRKHTRAQRNAVAPKTAMPSGPAAAPIVPVAPKAPLWPANEQPRAAKIVWNSHGLRIEAANSSLDEILREVSLQTGIKVEGMDGDQRIFGVYGPGPAREVLNSLLDGCGYNILMVGDRGAGTPQRIVLIPLVSGTMPPAASAAPPANNGSAEDEQPPGSIPYRPNPVTQMPPPGVPLHAPQQIMGSRAPQMEMIQQQQQPPPQ